jgi:trimethylamine corrinoid protein
LNSETSCEKLKRFVIEGEENAAQETALQILKTGVDPLEVIEKYLSPAMKAVGEKFEKGEYFLTNLMTSAAAMKAATNVLAAGVKKEDREKLRARRTGKVVIGTVSGDIHDIGKNIVAVLLEANGFDVYDLGKDVDSMKFIDRANEVQADIIAPSALMTTTKPAQKEVIDFLNEMKSRNKYMVIVGGSPTTKEWAEEIGADGWAETAEEAVRLAEKLMQNKR